MNNFYFYNPTKVYFGNNCIKDYFADSMAGYKRIMIAYGGGSVKKNGILDELTDILKESGKDIIEFGGIMSNPTYKKVLEGAELVKKEGIDLILGVGGGSVMDCCKVISLAAGYDGDVWDDFIARKGKVDFDMVPVAVVVTSFGTGSECNGGAIITNEELNIKTGRDYVECNPKVAFLNPEYTYSVPDKQIASGAFDTLSHLMETYFSEPDENNVSDDIIEALMRNVIINLRNALNKKNDYNAHSNLMWDATMAENKITMLGKRTDFECHQIEHQVGAYTSCNHGQGLGIIHPTYYRHIYSANVSKFARFAQNVWMIDRETMTDEELAVKGIDALENFIKEIGLPAKLRDIAELNEKQLREIAASCNISRGAYRQMTHEEILEILQECY